MAVNLLEEERLVYHDYAANTLEIRKSLLEFIAGLEICCVEGDQEAVVYVKPEAVETLRDALTCWLETGKLK